MHLALHNVIFRRLLSYRVQKSITSNQDGKFVSHFWSILWTMLGNSLCFTSAYHRQMGGQTGSDFWSLNRSLGNILRALVKDRPKQWDSVLPYADFAYSWSKNWTIQTSPFEIVNGMNPTNVANLIPVSITGHVGIEVADLTADIWSIEHVHEQIEKSGTGYRGATERHCHWVVFN